MTAVYIDESGHSGDIINSGADYDFRGQPYFALAGIGLSDDHEWAARLSDLRKRHRIPDGELKAKSLTAKPKFSAEVLDALVNEQAPLFVEVVDKRYFIHTHITSFQLLPACLGYQETQALHAVRNGVADFLYQHASDRVLDAFIAFCRTPGESSLLESFAELRAIATRKYEGNDAQVAAGVAHMVEVAEAEYREMLESDNKAWLRFRPPPDLNKHGREVWMLPNQTSFANIYARVNLYYGRNLAKVRLIHDQQFEVEPILLSTKERAEHLAATATLPYTPHSDYRFKEIASIDFAQSHEEIGVQLADIVAGMTMRYFRDLDAGVQIAPALHEAMLRFIGEGDPGTGYGLNQVVATTKVRSPK